MCLLSFCSFYIYQIHFDRLYCDCFYHFWRMVIHSVKYWRILTSEWNVSFEQDRISHFINFQFTLIVSSNFNSLSVLFHNLCVMHYFMFLFSLKLRLFYKVCLKKNAHFLWKKIFSPGMAFTRFSFTLHYSRRKFYYQPYIHSKTLFCKFKMYALHLNGLSSFVYIFYSFPT